jgi:hypothetical protein
MGEHPDFGEGGLVTDADVIPPIDHLLPTVPTTTDEALAMFDGAEPIEPDFMIGTWRGAELPTGHPLDGLLAASGWWGKQFVDPETVHRRRRDRCHGSTWVALAVLLRAGTNLANTGWPGTCHLPVNTPHWRGSWATVWLP